MSIRLMSEVWERAPYDKTTLLVLLALADQANDTGQCWPGMATIARRARCSARHAQRAVATLADDGWLTVTERPGHSSLYRVTMPAATPVDNPPTPAATPVDNPPTHDTGVTPDKLSPLTPMSPHPRHPCHPTHDTHVTHNRKRTTKEPSLRGDTVAGPVDNAPTLDGLDACPTCQLPAHTGPCLAEQDTLIPDPSPPVPVLTVIEGDVLDPGAAAPFGAQGILAEWIRGCGTPPPPNVKGQIARQVKQLLETGYPPDLIREALHTWQDTPHHPSVLSSVAFNLAQHGTDTRPRPGNGGTDRQWATAYIAATERTTR